ncbi:hypothetical protein DFP72DRAFT_858995, partial [Ephemerocybe angulata]
MAFQSTLDAFDGWAAARDGPLPQPPRHATIPRRDPAINIRLFAYSFGTPDQDQYIRDSAVYGTQAIEEGVVMEERFLDCFFQGFEHRWPYLTLREAIKDALANELGWQVAFCKATHPFLHWTMVFSLDEHEWENEAAQYRGRIAIDAAKARAALLARRQLGGIDNPIDVDSIFTNDEDGNNTDTDNDTDNDTDTDTVTESDDSSGVAFCLATITELALPTLDNLPKIEVSTIRLSEGLRSTHSCALGLGKISPPCLVLLVQSAMSSHRKKSKTLPVDRFIAPPCVSEVLPSVPRPTEYVETFKSYDHSSASITVSEQQVLVPASPVKSSTSRMTGPSSLTLPSVRRAALQRKMASSTSTLATAHEDSDSEGDGNNSYGGNDGDDPCGPPSDNDDKDDEDL